MPKPDVRVAVLVDGIEVHRVVSSTDAYESGPHLQADVEGLVEQLIDAISQSGPAIYAGVVKMLAAGTWAGPPTEHDLEVEELRFALGEAERRHASLMMVLRRIAEPSLDGPQDFRQELAALALAAHGQDASGVAAAPAPGPATPAPAPLAAEPIGEAGPSPHDPAGPSPAPGAGGAP